MYKSLPRLEYRVTVSDSVAVPPGTVFIADQQTDRLADGDLTIVRYDDGLGLWVYNKKFSRNLQIVARVTAFNTGKGERPAHQFPGRAHRHRHRGGDLRFAPDPFDSQDDGLAS